MTSGTVDGTKHCRNGFVGRHRELAELRVYLERARSGGGGGLVLLGGEPGIGNTRLAGTLAKEAESAGLAAAWGRSWEGGGAPTFWPWIASWAKGYSVPLSEHPSGCSVNTRVRDAGYDILFGQGESFFKLSPTGGWLVFS